MSEEPGRRGNRTAETRFLGRMLRWASRLAGAAFAVVVLLQALRVPGSRVTGLAGTAVLLAAPFLATVAAGVLYARERRGRLAATALLLLALLCVGAWLGARG